MAGAFRPRKPSSRWTKGLSCTNNQTGPLNGGRTPTSFSGDRRDSFDQESNPQRYGEYGQAGHQRHGGRAIH